MSHNESRSSSGHNISLRLRPYKPIKANKLEVQVWLNVTDMTDVTKDIDGIKVKINQGKVNVVIDSFLISKMRGSFEARAEYTLIRTIFDKILFKSPSKDYEGMVRKDATDLRDEISSLLNLNKFLF